MSIKRTIDLFLVVLLILIFFIPIIIISLLLKLLTRSPILFWSKRVGVDGKIFLMPKFTTMTSNTPVVATHLIKNPNNFVTPIGSFLRKSSLDELPQLWSIFIGHMSFVGPRPALYNQYDLINLRIKNGIDKLTPGLTGWAQINGRDNLDIISKVNFDIYYLKNKSIWFDLFIIFLTPFKVFRCRNISH